MARDRNLFKMLVNRLLDRLARLPVGAELGSEGELAAELQASRTTVRAVLTHLAEAGLLSWEGRRKVVLRAPSPSDRFDEGETRPRQELVEEPFLAWVLQGDLPPGTLLHESDLARRLGVPVATVREFLIRFEPFGLIEKQPNRHWVLKGFTRAFAEEMFAVREMFERHALRGLLAAAAPGGPLRADLESLRAEHEALSAGPEEELTAFPALDARFHRLLCRAAHNRFILDFSRTISIIVHFHYRWNKRDELRRNRAALNEHLAIVEAVLAGDAPRAAAALDAHLATAYRTLMTSVTWADA
ncbi:FCD domain-containing protein [Cereibacter sphaeroides]|uniref:FCD domain-containing protein n=1 Tax=Cereibacter sphaeroides TaxID=1063 RepID=A0AAX1UG68_CERSP|nr:GntR family transcriptional regulator [Cereibacter sphaeroides]AZB56581.1 FCD domain-containing protein [Cereibacter sphaeroides]AZB60855.1 FCD domain-containing protein [Cereibacter sphaeroides]RHZ91042.1 FCD domain-containing protein [Cereibacter sphaeroides]SNT08184.1 transcriptional regulator, GntR family [[Luteovulum] sphaeroides subsp. megalophilum]